MLVAMALLCAGNLASQEEPRAWLPSGELQAKTDTEIFRLIEGRYRSDTIQSGWSAARDYRGQEIAIDRNGRVECFAAPRERGGKPLGLYSFSLRLANSQGYIEVKIAEGSLSRAADNGMDELNAGSADWFSGLLYISRDHTRIMFGNNIEIDGGPATTWQKIR